MANKVSSTAFLLNLELMSDALEELSKLSESLQADSITLLKDLEVDRLRCVCLEKKKVW